MKDNNVLIIGNDNHSEKFMIYFLMYTDFKVFHISDLELIPDSNFLYCIITEPYFLDRNDIDKICIVDAKFFIFEKMISEHIENYYLLNKKLFNKWIPYHSRMFDYINIDFYRNNDFGNKINITWPCYGENMKKISHCLPNLLDFIISTEISDLNKIRIVSSPEKVYVLDWENNMEAIIYDSEEDNLVNINGVNFAWPNFVFCMDKFFSSLNCNIDCMIDNINHTKKIFRLIEEVLIFDEH